jgi:hypothetical protein
LFQLNSQGKQALITVTTQKSALIAIIAAMRYQGARIKRYKAISGELVWNEVPSSKELFYLKL